MKSIGLIVLACVAGALAQAPSPAPEFTDPDLRKPRVGAVSFELGGNSLSSLLGLKYSHFVSTQIAVDVGLGLSATGLRPGIYGRYLFSENKFSPFAYGGFKYGLGTGGQAVEIKDPEDDSEQALEIKGSPFLDFGVGLDYMAHNGFYITSGLGWSQLLGGENYEWKSFGYSEEADDMAKFVYGSGLALYVSVGYAF